MVMKAPFFMFVSRELTGSGSQPTVKPTMPEAAHAFHGFEDGAMPML
ncbi:protein of unknown function (plasmid) [Cupriavidus taiwanensis]|nr:protein of unknown function [Cupriavidus taiwanensis]